MLIWDDLVREKVELLYGVSFSNFGELKQWWEGEALPILTQYKTKEAKQFIDYVPVRTYALTQIEWAAIKIAATREVAKRLLDKFISDNSALPQMDEFKKSVRVFLVGSVGRFETTKQGDLDINIVADINPDNKRFYVDRLFSYFVKPLVEEVNKMLDELSRDEKPEERLRFAEVTDEDYRFMCLKQLLEQSDDLHKSSCSNLWAGCYCLGSDSLSLLRNMLPDFSSMVEFQRTVRFTPYEGKLKAFVTKTEQNEATQEALKYEYKLTVSGLLIFAAIRGLDPSQWMACYFRLAEFLKAKRLVDEDDWKAIQIAVLNCIEYRSDPTHVTEWASVSRHLDSLIRFTNRVLRFLRKYDDDLGHKIVKP